MYLKYTQDDLELCTCALKSDDLGIVNVKDGEMFHAIIPDVFEAMSSIVKAFIKMANGKNYAQLVRTSEGPVYVNIENNSVTSDLFELFTSRGIYLSALYASWDANTGKLCIVPKLMKDFTKLGASGSRILALYIISIIEFLNNSSGIASIDPITCTLYANDTAIIPSLRTMDVNVEQMSMPKHDAFQFVNSVFARAVSPKSMTQPTVQFNLLYAKGQPNDKPAGVFITVGGTHNAYVAYMPTKLKTSTLLKTNVELFPLEISYGSSTGAALGVLYDANVPYVSVMNAPLDLSKVELYSGDVDSDLYETFDKEAKNVVKTMLSKGAIPMNAKYVKDIKAAYKVDIRKGASAFDPDAIKESYKDDSYAQELYKQCKPYYDTFKLHNLDANVDGFGCGKIYSMIFIGESGTGKSTAARVLPYRCGMPFVSVNFSVNLEEADLFGSLMPNAKKVSAADPEFVWQDGIITKAVRNGYTAILEEINFARPGVLGKLNSLLDESRQLDLANGEIVHAHPNFRIIATCNIAYEGTNRFNKALVNRFNDVTVFTDISKAEAIKVVMSRTGYSLKANVEKVYDVYEALKKFAKEQNVSAVVSLRQLLTVFSCGKYYESAEDAVKRIILNGAFIEDQEYQETFEKTVLTAFDLSFKL